MGALHMNNSANIFTQDVNKLHGVIDGVSVFAKCDQTINNKGEFVSIVLNG
jgi:hypothetical protein